MAEEGPGDFDLIGESAQRIAQGLDQKPDLVALDEAAFRRGFLQGAKAAVNATWGAPALSDSPKAYTWPNRVTTWKHGDVTVRQTPPMPFD